MFAIQYLIKNLMNTFIIAIAVTYILVLGLILRTFNFMRDKSEKNPSQPNNIIKPKPYPSKKLLT